MKKTYVNSCVGGHSGNLAYGPLFEALVVCLSPEKGELVDFAGDSYEIVTGSCGSGGGAGWLLFHGLAVFTPGRVRKNLCQIKCRW